MSFSGRAGEFFSMLARGTLLLVPTFGFYRFWLITRLRRHLWANTRIGEDAFEYLGTAREMLIGFLMALAILTPIYLGYFLVALYLEEQQRLAGSAVGLMLYVLGRYASYRGWRYRLNRTAFRGLRFRMGGSAWTFAGRAVAWDLMMIATLGLAYPWRVAALERYRMAHTRFGTLQGRFLGTGGSLFREVWLFYAAVFVGIPLIGVLVGPVLPVLATLLVVLVLAFAALNVYTRQIRWRAAHTRLGEVAFRSDLLAGDVAITVLLFVLSLIGLVLVFAVVGVAAVLFVQQVLGVSVDLSPSGWQIYMLVAGSITYAVVILGLMLLYRQIVTRGLWAKIVSSTLVLNTAALDIAVATGDPERGGLDQGFADLLDSGGI